MKKIALVLILLETGFLSAQSAFGIQFQPVIGHEKIVLEQPISLTNKDSVRLNMLRFYLSNFVFFKNGRSVFTEADSHHLLDGEDPKSLFLTFAGLHAIGFDSVQFDLGIDSSTTVSGAMGGDLDPTNGMFWAWQSGYIHFKMEGISSRSTSARGAFQIHLGGYLPPFQTLQTIRLPVSPTEKAIIYFDLAPILDKINWAQKPHIMSPCSTAVDLSKILAKSFSADGG